MVSLHVPVRDPSRPLRTQTPLRCTGIVYGRHAPFDPADHDDRVVQRLWDQRKIGYSDEDHVRQFPPIPPKDRTKPDPETAGDADDQTGEATDETLAGDNQEQSPDTNLNAQEATANVQSEDEQGDAGDADDDAEKPNPPDQDGDGESGGSLTGDQSTRAKGAAADAAERTDDEQIAYLVKNNNKTALLAMVPKGTELPENASKTDIATAIVKAGNGSA